MARSLNQQKTRKRLLSGWIKGGLFGAAIGALPGLLTYVLVYLLKLSFFGAYSGINESSSLLFWLGLLIGGSAGTIVGTIVVASQLVIEAILQAEEGAIQEAASIPLPGRK